MYWYMRGLLDLSPSPSLDMNSISKPYDQLLALCSKALYVSSCPNAIIIMSETKKHQTNQSHLPGMTETGKLSTIQIEHLEKYSKVELHS